MSCSPRRTFQGSEYAGPGAQDAGLQQLRARVGQLPRKTFIVLYCGCCPWNRCPNVGPAYNALTDYGIHSRESSLLWPITSAPIGQTRGFRLRLDVSASHAALAGRAPCAACFCAGLLVRLCRGPHARTPLLRPENLLNKKAPDFALTDLSGQSLTLARFPRQSCSAQLLGHVVRAVPGRDAGLRGVAAAIRPARIRRSSASPWMTAPRPRAAWPHGSSSTIPWPWAMSALARATEACSACRLPSSSTGTASSARGSRAKPI